VSNVALIHNAATFTRDMHIRYDVPRGAIERLGGQTAISIVGGERLPFQPGSTITLPRMNPGENRWIKVTIPAAAVKDGEILPVYFYDLKDGKVVSGFGIGIRGTSAAAAIDEALRNHIGAFSRIAALYGVDAAKKEAALSAELLRGRLPEAQFVSQLRAHVALIDQVLSDLDKRSNSADLFDARAHFADLRDAIAKKDVARASLALDSLANTVDARVTSIELAKGNPADILQTLHWGRDLFSSPRLAKAECAAQFVRDSDDFERALELRKAQLTDYPRLLSAQRDCLAYGGRLLGVDLGKELDTIGRSSTDYAAIQKAHSDLLTRLSEANQR
jgi:hypothetical protein